MRGSDAPGPLLRAARWAGRARGEQRQVQILHIGKTGGSQLIRLCQEVNARLGREVFAAKGHGTRLADLPGRAAFIFGVRDPVTRFRSAFYSRKRQGRPLYDVPWRPDEARAFAGFAEANDLAEALFADGPTGTTARAAIQSITHAAQQQVDWFTPMGFFLLSRPPLTVIRQEAFAADWADFMRRLGLSDPPQPVDDPVRAHRNDYSGTPPLSERAVANLNLWYARDRAFRDDCEAWMADPPALPDWLRAAAR